MAQPSVLPIVRNPWWGPLTIAVLVLPLAARVAPWPVLATALRFAQATLVVAGIAVYARHGIRMRRGVWTTQSWRRFVASVVVSLTGVALMLAFAAGVDARWSWVGASRSATRLTLGLAVTVAGIVGAVMFGGAMIRFASDDPQRQYDSRLARMLRILSRR
jgi:NAD/NADP transhydrogenase beta subunit